MFTSSRRGRGGSGVRWVEPGRRRRRRLPVLPFVILVLLLAAGGAVAYVLHDRASDRAALRDTAVRFASAWEKGRPAAMYAELDADAQSKYTARRFAEDYRMANAEATVQKVVVGRASKTVGGKVTVPVAVRTKLFGTLRGRVALPVTRDGERVGVRWRPYLRLPGLRPGERVRQTIRARPRRASVLAADGRRLDREPTAQSIAGRAPAEGDPGFGLEAAYNDRLAGRPSAELRFGSRRIAATKARRGRSVRSTIRPGPPARRRGGAGRPAGRHRGGAARATARCSRSPDSPSPRPSRPARRSRSSRPSAALQAKIATLGSTYPVRTAATLSGVKLRNASDESCGGSLTASFTHSCNSVFAPLGAKLGARKMVAAAERFGFNSTPRVPRGEAEPLPARPQGLARGRRRLDRPGARARHAGADGGGRRDDRQPRRLPGAADRALRQARPPPRGLAPGRCARCASMMLSVVRGGTGTAAAVPGVEVAGKTGTAELRPTAGGPQDPKNTDAWFVAFAPAGAPKVAVAVMLVGAGQGGATAAPLARQVLQAAL